MQLDTAVAARTPTGETLQRAHPRRVALVHDFLLDLRGAERVFAALCDIWPGADIFTAVYDQNGTQGRFAHRNVFTSFLQHLRPRDRNFRTLLPLYPLAMEQLDLSDYDLVVSSSSAWAHGVIVNGSALHVCYCHNPFRYAWGYAPTDRALGRHLLRPGLDSIFARWRGWDRRVAREVDRYVANSQTTRHRIAACFRRESDVVYPAVDLSRFEPSEGGGPFLVVSKLMRHKHIDVAVRAFTKVGQPLVIVGDGPDMKRLQRLAGPTVEFTGRLPDEDVAALMHGCTALVVTAIEEFGIAAIEAQAAGRPVIAFDGGGVRETVHQGVTGAFFESHDPDSLAEVIARFDSSAYDPWECARNAARFGFEHFRMKLLDIVADAWRSERRERRRLRRPALI